MARLTKDEIKFIMTLDASDAESRCEALKNKNKDLRASLEDARKELKKLEKEENSSSEEKEKLRKTIKELDKEIKENDRAIERYNLQVDDSTKTINQLSRELKAAQYLFRNTSKAAKPEEYERLRRRIGELRTALNEANEEMRNMSSSWDSLRKMQQVMIGVFFTIGQSITENLVSAFKNAFNIIVDFEKANSQLAAILGTTKDQIDEMTKAARRLGATTSYSAAEVTQLQIELAKMGFAEKQILDMEEATLKFAKAVGTDLGSAAAFAGSALRIFGKDADQTEETLASFAVATTKTSLDFGKLQQSLATVGPVAAAVGLSVEDTTALLGQLANAGFDASSAATATRNILLALCDANGDLAKALGGPVKSADELAAGLQKLNAEGIDLAKTLELTDKQSVAAFSTFLANADNLTELRDSISGVTEAFTGMANETANNVAGALAGLQSASEELILTISEGTEGPIKGLIETLTSLVGWVSGTFVPWMQRWGKQIMSAAAAVAGYKIAVIAATNATKAWAVITRTITGVKATFKAMVVATTTAIKLYRGKVQEATTATQVLSATMKSIPWVQIISLVTAAAAAMLAWGAASSKAAKETKELTRAEQEELEAKEKSAQIVADKTAKVRTFLAVAENEKTSLQERKKACEELNKIMPTYNAHIDESTGKYIAATGALNDYIETLQKSARLKYYDDMMSQASVTAEQLRDNMQKAIDAAQGMDEALAYPMIKVAQEAYSEAMAKVEEVNRKIQNASSEGLITLGDTVEDTTSSTKSLGTAAQDTSEKLLKAATATADLQHQTRLLDIEREKSTTTQHDYVIKTAEETIRWTEECNAALTRLSQETDQTNTVLLDKISKRQTENERTSIAATMEINKENTAKMQEGHTSRLAIIDAFYTEERRIITKKVTEGATTQEAAELYLTARTREQHTERLAELKSYLETVKASETMTADERRTTEEKLNTDIASMRTQVLTDTADWMAKIRELTSDTGSRQGMLDQIETQRKAIVALYDTIRAEAEKSGEDVTAIEEAKQRKLAELDEEQRQRLYEITQITGATWADEYENELAQLKAYHRKGLISEKDYQKARFTIQAQNAKKYFDLYSGQATTMFGAIQEAEIAASDAKYDALIRQAENNGEDTAELEQEKENKKLEIQKKYADVNFAMKAGQIIADTAVAIMKAFADLGPIGGAVSAAMLTATGAAQLAIANSERQRIKSMQPANVKSAATESTVAPTAKRTLTGYSDGGYTGDGGRHEVAGIVHKGEYVVPKPIMAEPAVLDAVEIIESVRRDRMNLPSAPRRFADGGFTGDSGSIGSSRDQSGSSRSSGLSELRDAVADMRVAIEDLQDIRAYVVLRDLEKAQAAQERARAPFTRNRNKNS